MCPAVPCRWLPPSIHRSTNIPSLSHSRHPAQRHRHPHSSAIRPSIPSHPSLLFLPAIASHTGPGTPCHACLGLHPSHELGPRAAPRPMRTHPCKPPVLRRGGDDAAAAAAVAHGRDRFGSIQCLAPWLQQGSLPAAGPPHARNFSRHTHTHTYSQPLGIIDKSREGPASQLAWLLPAPTRLSIALSRLGSCPPAGRSTPTAVQPGRCKAPSRDGGGVTNARTCCDS